MQNIAKIYENQSLEKFFGTARIVRVEGRTGQVKIGFTDKQTRKEVMARPVSPFGHSLSAGEEVLVVEDNNGDFYVIGVLGQSKFNPAPVSQLVVSDGTFSRIDSSEKGQALCVYSNNNELLFEYDPQARKARVFSNSDDVAFVAPKGNIELKAGGSILLNGHRVEIKGKSGIGVSVGEMIEQLKSSLELKPGKISVSSQEVNVSARRASFFLEEARNNIKAIISKIGTVKLVVDKLETTASTIIEKTINAYRTTENLNQVKAGRMRMLIHKTFHLKSKSAIIKAEDDVKVKGEKIHLG